MSDVTESEGWLLTTARRALAAYLLLYGAAAWVSPRQRLPAAAISDFADILHVPPAAFLGVLFVVPGVLILLGRTARLGILLAVAALSVFEVGLLATAIRGDGTLTAPVNFAFVLLFVAGLHFQREKGVRPL